MNAASASLGTVLVQRLDALLGTTLSQQANLVSGARPDAVSQPAQAYRNKPADNPVQRSPQENIHRATTRVAAGRPPLTSQTHADAKPSAPTQTASSVELRLGATARLILDLLTQYPQHMPVQGKTPLLDLAPGQTAQHRVAQTPSSLAASAATAAQTAAPMDVLASWLRQALVQCVHASGMFYESHLAQLALGARRAASLHEEPQAHARAGADTSTIAPETQTLVRQQLEVLAHQTFAWQGQVWPQTDMHWEIRRHPSPDTSSPDTSETPEHWASHVTLDLPTLGHMHAQLTLSGEQVRIHLQAVDCAPQLQQHADALRQRLAGTGLHLTQLSITANTVDVPPSDAPSSDTSSSAAP